VRRVVSFASVTELILRCKRTRGVVEQSVKHDAEGVYVRDFARRSALTRRPQLYDMDLTEVPSELFRLKNAKTIWLGNNNLCSLPSEIAHLPTLEKLDVRFSKRLHHDLTKSHVLQVNSNQLTSLPPELGLLTNLKWLYVRHSRQMDLDLTLRHVLSGRPQPAHVAPSRNRAVGTARAALCARFELTGS
jgi:Leucine-rich repeat (LRR) protein